MNKGKRAEAFAKTGEILSGYRFDDQQETRTGVYGVLDEAVRKAMQHNQWFTPENLNLAISSISEMLDRKKLEEWLSVYEIPEKPIDKTVAVIMAGNIPMVGFHDFLSVLVTGNNFLGKLSSDDPFLLPAVASILTSAEPSFSRRISFTSDQIRSFDAVIATGSNNSANYFRYYFSKYPHLIRKNRSGVAVLTGDESEKEISAISDDIFYYFGLGCRNVSKIFLPAGFDMDRLPGPFHKHSEIIHHHKYNNNYSYQRSILLLNNISHLDTGYLLLREDPGFSSPVGVLFYEFYDSEEGLRNHLLENEDKIQCVVSAEKFEPRPVDPGNAQHPGLSDYADGVDTIAFLLSLSK